ncbi:MAG: hypothetical protein IJY62_00250 [Clostridia bacterium]|nr:hypothetical protein [Clostridia bacterium]
MNILRDKIRKRKKICGPFLNMGEVYVADIFAREPYDYVWVDTEHSSMDYGSILNCLTVLKAHQMPAVVRLQMDNYNHTKRILEMGPDGVIFPNVETAEYADKCMRSTLYPPLGNRGAGPLLGNHYGRETIVEYASEQTENLCRFIQIESVKAIENLPEIMKNPYIDGYILGPCDLSGALGILGEIYHEKNISQVKKAIKLLKEHGKFVGVAFTSIEEEEQRRWLELGVDMIASGADFDFIFQNSRKNARQLQRLFKEY